MRRERKIIGKIQIIEKLTVELFLMMLMEEKWMRVRLVVFIQVSFHFSDSASSIQRVAILHLNNESETVRWTAEEKSGAVVFFPSAFLKCSLVSTRTYEGERARR